MAVSRPLRPLGPTQGSGRGSAAADSLSEMDAATERGIGLLLAHCAAVERLEQVRPSATERLEDELGPELARLLTGALTPRRRRLAA